MPKDTYPLLSELLNVGRRSPATIDGYSVPLRTFFKNTVNAGCIRNTSLPAKMYCIPFKNEAGAAALARDLEFSLAENPHPLCLLAATELQEYLRYQQEWQHNFGLAAPTGGRVAGKMFGVLAVRKPDGALAYLAAFSGKLAGANHHARFVPPVFDTLADGGFVNTGMQQLTAINAAIHALDGHPSNAPEIDRLKAARKTHSVHLQQRIFEHYHFVNKAGRRKALLSLFKTAGYQQPPAGAGECAAPKLLQYAFQHGLTPLALTEFWWGLSPKSATWKHGHFYAPCREKCAPILAFMLGNEA